MEINEKNLNSMLYFFKNFSFFKFDSLINIFCVDTKETNRYFLYYNLISTKYKIRLLVRTRVAESMMITSVAQLYKSANWLEREVWDFLVYFFIIMVI